MFKKRVKIGQADFEKEVWDVGSIFWTACFVIFVIGLIAHNA